MKPGRAELLSGKVGPSIAASGTKGAGPRRMPPQAGEDGSRQLKLRGSKAGPGSPRSEAADGGPRRPRLRDGEAGPRCTKSAAGREDTKPKRDRPKGSSSGPGRT